MAGATMTAVSDAPFGTLFADAMGVARTTDGAFTEYDIEATAPLSLHPGTHALHYGSSCFEGLKAHRGTDGQVRIFRADRHAERLAESARRLCLPVPDPTFTEELVAETVAANLAATPEAPCALYLRPVLMGIDENIGAAAHPTIEALLYVLASPVGDYFAGGDRALSLWVETDLPRTTPQFGRIKTGANYAMALGLTRQARREHDVDQVLFAPDGTVQETGAANVLLLADDRIVTPSLDDAFLHGVTRDSLLTIARDRGMAVEEREVTIDEVLDWCQHGEIALSGTAAVLAAVGTLVTTDGRSMVGDGLPGFVTGALRDALLAVQRGQADDPHAWTRLVG